MCVRVCGGVCMRVCVCVCMSVPRHSVSDKVAGVFSGFEGVVEDLREF